MVEHVACVVRKRDAMSARMSENTAAKDDRERTCNDGANGAGAPPE